MRRFFNTTGIIVAVIALVLAVTPKYNMAYIAVIIALVFGFISFFMARQQRVVEKSVQLIFLLALIALGLSFYKTLFVPAVVPPLELQDQNTEPMDEPDKTLEELEADQAELRDQ